MVSNATRLQAQEHAPTLESLPASFDTAVLRFEPDDAVAAFDLLGRGGQYGIVGKFTYVVTPQHVALLDEAKIPYQVQSAR